MNKKLTHDILVNRATKPKPPANDPAALMMWRRARAALGLSTHHPWKLSAAKRRAAREYKRKIKDAQK